MGLKLTRVISELTESEEKEGAVQVERLLFWDYLKDKVKFIQE